jgi:ubiquinol-cytochrome c reductase cytochrome b subunit
VLTYQGAKSPWSPLMTGWSGTPVPESLVRGRTPLELQGAAVFQNKQCRNCHALQGTEGPPTGGRRGPDLSGVGTRLTRDQIIDQVSNGTPSGLGDPGGGNMPAYGKQMKPAEMTALTAFLVSLRPPGRPPARPASEPQPPPPAAGQQRAER